MLFVLELNGQLISVGKFEEAGFSNMLKNGEVYIGNNWNKLLFGDRDNWGQHINNFATYSETVVSGRDVSKKILAL